MRWVTTAHTIQNAWKSGLLLSGSYDSTTPEWIGTAPQFEKFTKLEEQYAE